MYHCHVKIYFIGIQDTLTEFIENIAPKENFTHTFCKSDEPDAEMMESADVLFVNLQHLDVEETMRVLAAHKKNDAELILLVERDRITDLQEDFSWITDIWMLPMSEKEIGFRFRKWQQDYKQKIDLWQSEQFVNLSIDSSPDLIWFKDKDGVHEIVNASFCKVVNKTKEQVQGQRHAYIWDVEQDDPACIESEQEVMRRRETCVSEEIIQTGEGERILTTYKSPLYDLDGSVMGTVGVAVDVTQQEIYKEEINKKNRTLEMLFSTIDCGMMCHSLDGKRIRSINRAALRLLDYESQEEMERDGFNMVAQTVVDEDKPKLRDSINSLTEVGDSVSVEYSVQHRDGKRLYILGNVKLVEEDGDMYYQRFLLDFTAYKLKDEQKWAMKNKEIQYQEQLFETFSTFLSDNVDDVYMMLDKEATRVEFVTPNIERVLGVSWKEAMEDLTKIGRATYIAGEKIERENLVALEPGMSLEPMDTERLHCKTGELKWFHESVYCVLVQGIKKIIVYISDRTKEKQVQNTLSEALNMAQTANKAKSAFLSNVSHDIRTPMNAIIGFIPLLQEEADNPEHVQEYTRRISDASQHLLGLINDVLDIGQIEGGKAVLNISELNLAELIDEINTIIRPQAIAKKQKFEISTIDLTTEHLLGDKLRINQILMNILSNAVKYTQEGGSIKMTVDELHQVNKSYSRIRFTVRDNGRGMSEEYQKVIFEPFSREQNTAWNKTQGTGLGMTITKGLVDLMQGTIKVESKLGVGTTFTVELELRNQNRKDDPKFWSKYHVARMLVADGTEKICSNIVKKMAGTGVEVNATTSGSKAWEMIQSAKEEGKPYDLIMLDWDMPDLDGHMIAHQLLETQSEKKPILLFTTDDWREIEHDALEIGVEHFLQKPFFITSFQNAIQHMMDTGHERKENRDDKGMLLGKRVLAAEDIDINQLLLVKLLSTLGAECDIAEDGKQALEMFTESAAGQYDVILMDIQMPIMDGYEATKEIRASAHPQAGTIPIIAMSANAFVEDARKALNSGMNAHISKPIVFEQFKKTLREIMDLS